MLLQLDEGRFAGRGCRRTAVDVLRRVRRVRRIHPGLGSARGALVRAPQVRKVERVGADRGHFIEMNCKAVVVRVVTYRTLYLAAPVDGSDSAITAR